MQFVDLYRQYLSIKEEIDTAIASVIEDSSFVRGQEVEAFEEAFAEKVGVRHCISCANGTDAIYIALNSLGLRPGDEVITTAHSWISTSETITQAGGRVVFCDTEEDFFTIDPQKIEPLINEKTKGIIPVHLYGQPADMDPILELAKKYGLWVIEDCAQAHLATYKGRTVGTIGDAATFSFYPGKNLGAMGDAGALVTNRDDVAEYASLFARHGGKGEHKIEGINSRLDGIQAAILNVKLGYIDSWTEKRQYWGERYRSELCDVDGVKVPRIRDGCSHVFHLFVIRTKMRDKLRAELRANGVPTVINYTRPLPFYSAYEYLGHDQSEFPVASRHAREILSIPIFPELQEEEWQGVVHLIKQITRDCN